MTLHDHLHRRHKRAAAAFPDPVAVANALPNPVAEAEPAADPAQTLVSIVYVTASKTFDGPVGGYTTLTAPVQSSSSPKADTTPTSKPTIKVEPSTKSAETTPSATSSATSAVKKSSSRTVAETTLKTSSGLPSSLLPTSSLATSIPLLAASSSLSHDSQSATGSSTASAASSTETASKSGGMNAGGKAGLAVGIVLLLGTVLALVLFCFKRRRDAVKKERLDDEKTEPFAGAGRAASTRTTATAPRLSLRPVTQFLPNLGEKRQSRGNALALTPASAAAQAPRQSPWERPMGGQDAARNNPFGNHAEVIDATNANGPPVVDDVSAGGEIVAAGAAIGLARGASKRGPNQLDFTRSGPFKGPPSPAGTEFSMSSEAASPHARTAPDGTAVAIAAAGGPPNSTVHRVQLDFKPSMDDELELQAGQLIRLLHEYDDGWALCIRLDRSAQGVVPRTCLSTRPVKPRPQQNGPRGPPPPGMRVPGQQPRAMASGMSPHARPMSPGMSQGPRPMSPSGNRPMTPNGQQGRPMTPQGRPMTPTGPQYNPQRPMTPNGQQGRPRSASAAQTADRRLSPPGPSPMNPQVGSPPGPSGPVARKPVGQAL